MVAAIYDPAEYIYNLGQWLYSKRGPFPGFQFAAMQLPCLQGLWLA